MPKRPAEDDANVETAIQAAGIKDNDWVQKLLEVDKEQLTLIVSLIANKSNIDNKSIKKARTELSSFSTTKWIDFAARAGLPDDPSYLGLEPFVTPVYQLPPSFHKAVFENTQDVYQEAVEQTGGVRILDHVTILRYLHFLTPFFWQYIVPILSLFHGRVIDKPEEPEEVMPANAFATGGEVEHKVRSTFQLIEGYSCEASAGHIGRRGTLFRYRGKVRQAV